jgi:DNA-binding MarR family transcriptional regulator
MTVPLNGQVIGQAERATRALLDRLLAGVGTPFEQWVALNLTATSGPVSPAGLAARLRIPVDDATAAVSALVSDGLLDREGALTAAGRARHDEITTGLTAITARLYGDLPPDDLAVAGRVLTLITARATAELTTP